MGKNGPCCHCGVTSTPLWRNGPPEKPVLCNACGSRWRTKGSLANYTPLHARGPIDWEEPKYAKVKSTLVKSKLQKFPKRKQIKCMVESEHEIPFSVSDQNYIKASEEDASNRSSSESAVSYTESCGNFGNTDASDWTGSAQSNAWDSQVPSKKRSLIRLKPSPVEKLTKDLYSIWHEQQSSNISRSSDDDLLYEGETPIGSVEIGNGGVLLRYPCSKTVEEESEASSLPLDSKLVNDAYSRHESYPVNSEMKKTSFPSGGKEKHKKSAAHLPKEYFKRDSFSSENSNTLQDKDSILRSADLKDIVSLQVFLNHFSFEEQQRLMKYLPSVDIAQPSESLKSMFSSTQFVESLSYFQQLLQEGVFDLSFYHMNVEECGNLKRLVLKNLTKSRWVEHYKQLKAKNHKQVTDVERVESGAYFLPHTNLKATKMPREIQNHQFQESMIDTRISKRLHRSCLLSNSDALVISKVSNEDVEDFVDNEGSCFSPRSLFASPPDRCSMLRFADDNGSDHDLLLDVHCGASFPDAELLEFQPCFPKAISNSSLAESAISAAEESLCNFPASSLCSLQLKKRLEY